MDGNHAIGDIPREPDRFLPLVSLLTCPALCDARTAARDDSETMRTVAVVLCLALAASAANAHDVRGEVPEVRPRFRTRNAFIRVPPRFSRFLSPRGLPVVRPGR